MDRKQLKAAVKAAVPSVYIVEADGLGTKTPRYRLECRVPVADLPKLDAFAASIGRRAYGIGVLCYPGFALRCINIEGKS